MKKFPWLDSYPSGIPAQIDNPEFNSLPDMMESSCTQFGDHIAFENMGKGLTYEDINQLSIHFAAYLQHICHLKKGDRIAIQMPNILDYPVAMLGALRAGLIVVNTNPLYTQREMEHQFKDSGVSAIIILANFASKLENILPQTDIQHVIIARLGDLLGSFKGMVTNLVVKYIKRLIPAYKIRGSVSFTDTLKIGSGTNFEKPHIQSDDIAFLQYTGGTTGVSKGAQLSHGNILAHTRQIELWFKPLFSDEEPDSMITAIPLYHIFALSVNCMLMWRIGAKNILVTNPRDMKDFVKILGKQPFTLMTGVNTLFNGLINQPGFEKIDFSKLKGTIGGGMAVQDFVAKKWKEITGTPLVEGYGLSESSPVLSCNPLDGTERIGTIGLPTPSTEMGIFDEQGSQLDQGEIGEICARGPQVMCGYWNKDNATVFFEGGWLRTGDMGVMDKTGFFRIVDRKKDMINVSGFNVYPNEIENVVANMDKVLEVAAVGVPDEHSTEVVKIFVVKKDLSLSKEEINAYCKENLTGYKRPKFIEFREELPKSNVGKIIRRHLRED